MKNIIRSVVVSILVILLVSGIVFSVTNWVLTYTYEIVGGDSVITYTDAGLTKVTTGGELFKPPRWTSTYRFVYVQNITGEDITVRLTTNHPETFDVTLWVADDDPMVEQVIPTIFRSDEVKYCQIELYVYPEAPLGIGTLEVYFNTVVYQGGD